MTRLPHLLVLVACFAILRFDAAMAYQTSDLAGSWRYHALASGPGAPWWERANLSISANGSATGTAVTSTGDSSAVSGSFAVGPTGWLALQGAPLFQGALDVDKTVIAASDTWSGFAAGTTELRVGLKTQSPYALSELAGAWEVHSIASGPGAPWWQRGRITVDGSGSFAGTFTENNGQTSSPTGAFGLATDGTVTFAGSAAARGTLDAGRTVMVMTSTWSGFAAGTTDLTVGLKMAPTYLATDLAGRWEAAILATGPGSPWWSRGTLAIAADGSYSGSMLESTGGSHPVSGTLALSVSGVVTRSGSATARGALDAGRSVMVITDTWSTGSPGTSEMLVAVRTGVATTDAPATLALAFALEPVRPNPGRGTAPVVRFALASNAPAWLELIDVTGRLVAAREVGALGGGRHEVALGQKTDLNSGLYWVRLRQGDQVRVTRLVVLQRGR